MLSAIPGAASMTRTMPMLVAALAGQPV